MDIKNIHIKEKHNDDQDQSVDFDLFAENLRKLKTINLFNTRPEVIPSISEVVREYVHMVSDLLDEPDPDVRGFQHWESFKRYTEAKNILNCISETLSPCPHEPGVYEPTYLDILNSG